jgi:pimeloyl-ACP methyl ester carboxylesterase
MWDEPSLVRFLDRLSSFSRHVWFDHRGRGASDPVPHVEERFAEAIADDMLALVDHLGWERVALVGDIPPLILFAASHPERTRALVMINSGARVAPGVQPGELSQVIERSQREWGTGARLEYLAPSVAGDARLRRWLGRSERLLSADDRLPAALAMDMRPALSSVQAPTLFVCRQGVRRAASVRDDAGQISGAKVVELPDDDYLFFAGDSGPMLDAIEEFFTGQLPAHHSDRVLATVLFTDIVGPPGTRPASATAGGRRCSPPMTLCWRPRWSVSGAEW